MTHPIGWGATEDIVDACGDCGCYTGHLPSCPHFEKTSWGPDQTNIGNYVVDGAGHYFEIEDETPDGQFVLIRTGHGETMIDLAEGYQVVED